MMSDEIFPCTNFEENCLQKKFFNKTLFFFFSGGETEDLCVHGSLGPLCSLCKIEFTHYISSACVPCSPKLVNLLLSVIVMAVFLMILFLLIM